MGSDARIEPSGAHAGRRAEAPSLAELAAVFLRIGATGFGGMMPLLAMMHRYLVEERRCVDDEEFAEAVTIGQILPGPVAVDAATHLGHLLRGVAGAIVTTACILLPAAILIVVLSPLYFAHGSAPLLIGGLRGAGAVVVAVVASALVRLGRPVFTHAAGAVIAVASALLVVAGWVQPSVVLLGAGLLGALFLRPPAVGAEGGAPPDSREKQP